MEAIPGMPDCAFAIDHMVADSRLPEGSSGAVRKGELYVGLADSGCNTVGHDYCVGKEGGGESHKCAICGGMVGI